MKIGVSRVLLWAGFILTLVLISNQILAATCLDGAESAVCQTSKATDGNIHTGTSEQAKPMVDTIESMMTSLEAARSARMWARLYYIAPLIPFLMLIPLVLTYLLMHKPRRSVSFDVRYGLVCGSSPLGVIAEYFLWGGKPSYSEFLAIIVVGFLIIAIPGFFLSMLSRGRKSFLWGGAIVSDIWTAIYIFIFVCLYDLN